MGALGTAETLEIGTGRHCKSPYVCPFFGHCHADEPEHPVRSLPNLRQPLEERLREEGLMDIREIPSRFHRAVGYAPPGSRTALPQDSLMSALTCGPGFSKSSFRRASWISRRSAPRCRCMWARGHTRRYRSSGRCISSTKTVVCRTGSSWTTGAATRGRGS